MKKQRLNQWQPGATTEKHFCDNLLALFSGSRIASVTNKATLERDGFKRIREEVLRLAELENRHLPQAWRKKLPRRWSSFG